MNKTIVIKIGTAILTRKNGELDSERIAEVAKEVKELKASGYQIIIVSSGAVASGRSKLPELSTVYNNSKNKNLLEEQILAAIGQPELMKVYIEEFSKIGLQCAQGLVTRADFADRQRYLNLRTVTENLLRFNIIPIINENDFLSTEELDFSDNDQLACLEAAMIGAERLVVLTNVAGVFDRDPSQANAKIIETITDIEAIIDSACQGKSPVGKGGMKSKLLAADLVTSLGIAMNVIPGDLSNALSRLLIKEEKIGTYFPAKTKKIENIKRWIATGAAPQGKIIVSTYLADILKNKKVASILILGIEEVKNKFQKNDVVSVYDSAGKELGRGQIRYNADELKKEIKKYKTAPTEEAKIRGGKKIAIHYNNFIFK